MSEKVNLSSEILKNDIRNIAQSQQLKAIVLLFTAFVITHLTNRLILLPSSIANNDLLSDLSSLGLTSVVNITSCVGLWLFYRAFSVQPNQSQNIGLNLLKVSAILSIVVTPVVTLINVLNSMDLLSNINNHLVVIIVAILIFAVIFSPVAVYFIFVIRTINFVKKLYKVGVTTFPAKTIGFVGVITRVVGILIIFIASMSLFSMPDFTDVLGFVSGAIHGIAFIMAGDILCKYRRNALGT